MTEAVQDTTTAPSELPSAAELERMWVMLTTTAADARAQKEVRYGTDRVRSTPIAEQSIVGAAVGLALGGYRPVAEVMFMDFMTLASDQFVNHAAKFRYMSGGRSAMPLTVRTVVGNSRFGAQHAQTLEAWFMHTPGIKVVMAVPTGELAIPLGKAAVKRSGDDVTVVTYGPAAPGRWTPPSGCPKRASVWRSSTCARPIPFAKSLRAVPNSDDLVTAVHRVTGR